MTSHIFIVTDQDAILSFLKCKDGEEAVFNPFASSIIRLETDFTFPRNRFIPPFHTKGCSEGKRCQCDNKCQTKTLLAINAELL